MIKKILLIFFLSLSIASWSQTITLTTTSASPNWSPEAVVNSGTTLTWSTTGAVSIDDTVTNDPTFDFSSNVDGDEIFIEITGSVGFSGLTELDFWVDDSGNGGLITEIDISSATDLTSLNMRYNQLSAIDVSSNTLLTELNLRGNQQISSGTLNLDSNPNLEFLQADVTQVSSVSLAGKPNLVDVRLYDAQLTTAQLDQILIDLDNNGAFGGNLLISDNPSGISETSATAYDNLLNGKGWFIDVDAPPVTNVQTITFTTTSGSSNWSPQSVVNSGNTLKWSTTGAVTIGETEINDPTLDFSANTSGDDIFVTITSDIGFIGLTGLDFWVDDSGNGGLISEIDVSAATDLTSLNMRYNQLSNIDVSSNTLLTSLNLRGNQQISAGALNLDSNPNLTFLQADVTQISSVSLASKPDLIDIRLYDAQLTTAQLDQILIDLDANGASGGNLLISGNPSVISEASAVAYNSLTNVKGWFIDVDAPPVTDIQTITFTTTSASSNWSPEAIVNAGNTLKWSTTGAVVIGETEINDPTFDFSSNASGDDIFVTITSDIGFVGLTELDFWVDDFGNGGQITEIDVSAATGLTSLNMRYNQLSEIDVSSNSLLTELVLRGNQQISVGTLDLDSNPALEFLQGDVTQISSVSLASKPDLVDVRLNNAQLTTAQLDQILIDLDANGASGGNLLISGNVSPISEASAAAYNSLVNVKGWFIDVDAPPVTDIKEITLTTTSSSSTWQLLNVVNSGAVFEWEATNADIGTITLPGNNPVFDFSGNINNEIINITITSTDGFSGLTELDLWNGEDGVGALITEIDITNATALEVFIPRYVQLSTIDLDSNTALETFIIRGYNQIPDQALVTTNNTELSLIQIDGTGINSVDLSTNTLLLDVRLYNARLTSDVLDQVLIDLDAHGLTDGNLLISGNAGDLSPAAGAAYASLTAKNWFIDVEAPPVVDVQEITFTTTSASANWSPESVVNSGNILKWSTTGAVTIAETEINDPTFDFSSNGAGGEIFVTITSDVGFVGLTELDFWVDDNGNGGLISEIDVTNATDLTVLNMRYNQLSEIDVTQNVLLTDLILRGKQQISSGTVDLSANNALAFLHADNTQISTIDLSSKPNLVDVRLTQTDLTSTELDQIVIDLDNNGATNGNLEIANQNSGESLTGASAVAFASLINKDWNIDVEAPGPAGAQINITGNGIDIVSSAGALTSNGSDFGPVPTGTSSVNQFVIENNGSETLNILNFIVSSIDGSFSSTGPANLSIAAGASETFDVTFNPSELDNLAATILILSDAANNNTFIMNVAGEGVAVLPNQIMISQYYDGFTSTDDWIEVVNISGADIPADTYFLALYNEEAARAGLIENQAPNQNTPIPALAAGETILFKNSIAALPLSGNLGSAVQINSEVCNFDGDDVILISTSNGADCYDLRVDLMGNISANEDESPDPWGSAVSYIKGGCSSEEAHKDFDINDWTFIVLDDVNGANPSTNLALGTQVTGVTEFDGTSWSNGLPDQTRSAVIVGSFTGASTNFTACNLTVNSGVAANFDSNGATSNSIVLYGDLIVDGSLTIGDTESLVVLDPFATLGVITKIENSTPLDDINDLTYWSSPVEGSQISTIFAGSDLNRIFDYRPPNVNSVPNWGYWYISSGAMARGKGYTAPGPSTGIQTLTFTGVPHNGTWQDNLYYSGIPGNGPDANENYNFIGNPYPAAIDILKVMEDNGNVAEIALWTHGTEVDPDTGEYFNGDYVYYNSLGESADGVTKNIASSQGFMIRTIAGGIFNINASHLLIGQNDQFYKGTGKNKDAVNAEGEGKVWLRLVHGTEKSDILIGFDARATDDYDKYFDAIGNLYDSKISLIEKTSKFYSKIENDKFVIQGLGVFGATKDVNLGFDTKKAGWFKMSIKNKEGVLTDADMYLVDTYLNIKHDLSKSDYEFEATKAGEFSDRFRLEFVNKNADLGPIEDLDKDRFTVTNEFDTMTVISGKSVSEIKVYDLLGRMIIMDAPRRNSFQLQTNNVKVGTVMLIEARMEDGSMVSTKSIKY